MHSRHFPVAGPDAGHEFPLVKQRNMAHAPIVFIAPGKVDDIIKSGAPTTGHSTNPVWQFPAYNRANAIKNAA